MPSSASSGGLSPTDNDFAVISTQQYESGPPASKLLSSTDDAEVYEVVKEDEYVTRKKKTTQTTRNIEKRVQRQLLLEDGEVVHDTGPVVTEDATEDTVVHESQAEEGTPYNPQAALAPPGDGWVAVPGAVVVSEKLQSTVNSHQVVEDERETEEVKYCGDVTNKEVQDHLDGRTDIREICDARNNGLQLAYQTPQKRIVHESLRKWGTVDTQDVRESSKIQDGHVVTETERTTQHEQYENESLPDSGSSLSDGSAHEETRETQHNITHTKDEDFVEYYAVPKGGTLAQGVKLGEGMHVVSEDFHEDKFGNDLDTLSEKARKNHRLPHHKNSKSTSQERTDALTSKPLNYQQEEATRKFETNKWLQHHFGSESSKSRGSSIHDITEDDHKNNQATCGGNIITITMSPHPATPEDTVDASPPGRLRRWGGTAPLTSTPTPQAPPMPPPKPGLFGNSRNSLNMTPDDGLDKRMVDARARLRPTGRSLNDSMESNGAESSDSSKVINGRYGSVTEKIQVLPGISGAFTPPMTPTSPMSPLSPTNSYIKDDPVYGSRFRSGTPTKLTEPESPPPPLPTTEPPSYVARSQSFNVSSRPWQKTSSTLNYNSLVTPKHSSNMKKTYKSQDRLDSYEQTTTSRKPRIWPFSKRDKSPTEAYRDPSPPPRIVRKLSPHKHRAPSPPKYSAEAGTQTGPTPVPPPRTKRRSKSKPKNTYFFGENNVALSNMSNSLLSKRYSMNGSSSLRPIQTTSVESTTHYRQRNNDIPTIEKRYRTTKTITPVVVLDADQLRTKHEYRNSEQVEKSKSRHYRSMDHLNDAPRSTWTSTVDPRRRPRTIHVEDMERPTTLPRKSVVDSPNTSYFFGQGNSSSQRKSRLNGHSGSMMNVSNNRSIISNATETYNSTNGNDTTTLSSLRNGSRPVSRSHSFNVQPATKFNNHSLNKTFSESVEEKKTSSVYRSSPYLNLRSPNLIANIARSSSIKQLNDSNGDQIDSSFSKENISNEEDEKKRKVFMKGLLTNAPELYHYLHGEDNSPSDPPRLIRPPDPNNDRASPISPPTTTSPRYFTFGRDSNSSASRSNSTSYRGTSSNYTDSLGREKSRVNQENKINTESSVTNNNYRNSSNRKSAFNLKTAGSSLLYSPSFRNQHDNTPPWERTNSNERTSEIEDWQNKNTVTSSLQRNGPVLIQLRDWNTR